MNYLACDLGAESGRLMLGRLRGEKLTVEEVHRFPNIPVRDGGALCWNIDALWAELQAGLRKAAAREIPIASISTDSWGLDYVLLDENPKVLSPTYHYRDARTARGVARVQAALDWPTLFAETGIQFMPINTLYQLAAEAPQRLDRAQRLLMIGDAFNFFLSGVARTEVSLASTSAIYNPRSGTWSSAVISALDLPPRLFGPIVPSGTRLGRLIPPAATAGLEHVEVVASCSHDTGAAVAAVPASAARWAYISSGTWSLMGVETSAPVLSDLCRELNFTNEIGFGGSVRLLKNIVGLWIVQECRREWAGQGQEYDYATLTQMAEAAPAFRSVINAADPRFVAPGDMPGKIAAFCRETNQPVPDTPGATVRCVLESLALQYRQTLRELERLTGQPINAVHIVGGGSQNDLLNQLAADACGVPVFAGPVEATALGNILVQAIAMGELSSLAQARDLVRRSFAVREFHPR